MTGNTYKPHPNDIAEKFDDPQLVLLPPSTPQWQRALKNVDRTRPAPHVKDCWGYWLPDVSFMASTDNFERTARACLAWLRLRESWLLLLTDRPIPPSRVPTMREWKTYLNLGVPSPTEDAKAAKAREIFESRHGNMPLRAADGDMQWFGRPFAPTSEQQVREIIWELSQAAFRVELLQLDLILVPPPLTPQSTDDERDASIRRVFGDRPAIVSSLPGQADGLTAPSTVDRAASLDALRQLLRRWPGVPTTIRDSPPLHSQTPASDLLRVEGAMCSYYVQTFWERAGRAAAIPRRFPQAA